MDVQIIKAVEAFYGIPVGYTTEQFYATYVEACKRDGAEPKVKSTVIREVCKEFGLKIVPQTVHYFVKKG